MMTKYSILLIIFTALTAVSCSSLNYGEQRKTDLREEKLKSIGKGTRPSFPLDFNLIENNNKVNVINSITFEVALDKFAIMPIMTADMTSGIITTDWYSTTSNSKERVKFNIIIKNDDMKEDSIKVNMFKEKLDGNVWKTAVASSQIEEEIKQSILKQAKRIKVAAELS
jgi:hypothetical protein